MTEADRVCAQVLALQAAIARVHWSWPEPPQVVARVVVMPSQSWSQYLPAGLYRQPWRDVKAALKSA